MNKGALLICLVFLGFVLIGCAAKHRQVSAVELHDLMNGSRGRYSTMWRGTYYCGTKDGFHYLRHTMELGRDELLKIPTNDLPLAVMGKYPLPKLEWVEVSEVVLFSK